MKQLLHKNSVPKHVHALKCFLNHHYLQLNHLKNHVQCRDTHFEYETIRLFI